MALFGAQGNLAQRTEMVKHQTDDFNHLVFEHMGKIDIPVMFSAVDGNLNYAWLWAYADLKGKVLFGSQFRMYPEDAAVMLKIMIWFMQDPVAADQLGIRLEAGLCLLGPVGCGKTNMLKVASHLPCRKIRSLFKSYREISLEANVDGPATLLRFTKHSFEHAADRPRTWFFDDLGVESSVNYFGNQMMPMTEILMARYDYYTSHHMKTIITTNLNSEEIASRYGLRVRSRLREMVNLISFPANAKDKRE